MRKVVVCLLLSLFGVGIGCKRQATSAPPPIVSSSAERDEGSVSRADDAGEVADASPPAEELVPAPAPEITPPSSPAQPPEPDPDWFEKVLQSISVDQPPPQGLDSTLEPEIEPSPMDELGAVEFFALEIDEALQETVSADLRQLSFDIPVVLNQPVLQFLDYYQGRGRRIMELGLQRSGRYLDFFREVFDSEEVPQDLVYLPHVESLFRPRAYSRAHARGLWQFVLGTGRLYGLRADWWIDERSDVEKSTLAAARHLKDLYQEFGDWYLTLAAYNCGAGRIRRVLARYGDIDYWEMRQRRMLPRETRNYVPSFLASLIIFKHPEQYGFAVEPDLPVEYEEVPLEFQVDLRVVADLIEIKVDELLELNPQLRRGVTPYDRPGFALKVPLGTAHTLAGELAALPEDERLRVQHYRVRRGDTLSGIASRFGSSVRAIAEMNRIRNVHRLRLGQDLLIPSPGWRAPSSVSRAGGDRPSSYVVKNGDSLYRIARRHGLTVAQLAAWNNLRPSQTIFPGQRLKLVHDSATVSSQK